MHIVIVGYGRVGARTARILATEGHEVTVVDDDLEQIERAQDDDFVTVLGDGSDEEILQEADIESASAIGAFTADLNVNFAACMVGSHYGCRTILRIDEDYRQEIYEKYAKDVDEIVYPERLGAAGAKTALLGGDFNVISDLAPNLQLTVMQVQSGSPAVGKRISDLELPAAARLYAHGRARESLTIPLPGTTLEADDEVAFVLETDAVEDVRTQFRPTA